LRRRFLEKIKTEPKEKPEKILMPEEKIEELIIRPVPQKPPRFEKFLNRVVILTIVLVILTTLFLLWYFFFKGKF